MDFEENQLGAPQALLKRSARELCEAMDASGYCDLMVKVVSEQGVPIYLLSVNRKLKLGRSGRPLQDESTHDVNDRIQAVVAMIADGIARIRANSGHGSVFVEVTQSGGVPRFRVVVSVSYLV